VRGDAARWRAFVDLAREVFAKGDVWAASQPEPMPVLVPGAEGWATAPLHRACLKGCHALARDDLEGVVFALIETGHAGRYPEIIERWLATIGRVGEERARRRARTKQATFEDRDARMIEQLKAAAPPSALTSNKRTAERLIQEKYSDLSVSAIVRRESVMAARKRLKNERRTKCGVS
jgi:hypothetical protein